MGREAILNDCVQKLMLAGNPDGIVLFGSAAGDGAMGIWGAADLGDCVIERRRVCSRLFPALFWVLPSPCDGV